MLECNFLGFVSENSVSYFSLILKKKTIIGARGTDESKRMFWGLGGEFFSITLPWVAKIQQMGQFSYSF